MRKLTLGSLFDGSGGFPLAGIICGIEPKWASEVEPFPIRVTSKRIPQMKHLGDISSIPQMIPARGKPPEPSKSEPKVSLRTFTHLKFAISNPFIISNDIHIFICSNLFNVSLRNHITELFV